MGGLQFSGVLGWGDPYFGGQWVGEPKFGVVLEVSGGWGPKLGRCWVGAPQLCGVSGLRGITLDLESLGVDPPVLEVSGWRNP